MLKFNSLVLCLMALASIFTFGEAANAATVYGATVGGQGVVQCGGVTSYKPTETGRDSKTMADCNLVQRTTQIRAQIGLIMGCEYTLLGSPNGASVMVEYHTFIPRPGVKNPSTGVYYLETSNFFERQIGATGQKMMWSFGDRGEIVPGRWRQELRYEGRTLATCTYDVFE